MIKTFAAVLAAIAVTATPAAASINDRQHHQGKRIAQGWRSGELTGRETGHLARQQYRIARTEHRMRSDGRFTLRERARLHHRQDAASANIYAKKHNGRSR